MVWEGMKGGNERAGGKGERERKIERTRYKTRNAIKRKIISSKRGLRFFSTFNEATYFCTYKELKKSRRANKSSRHDAKDVNGGARLSSN
jgi:hypothetical protein